MDSYYPGMFPLDGECNYTSDESVDDGYASVAYCCEEVHDSYEYVILREDVECLDFGDCVRYCSCCGAMVWYEERSEKSVCSSNPEFSICCMKGKIQLPSLNRPPKLLWNLFNGVDHRSAHFLENICLYNSMFSFTSIGGKVDTS